MIYLLARFFTLCCAENRPVCGLQRKTGQVPERGVFAMTAVFERVLKQLRVNQITEVSITIERNYIKSASAEILWKLLLYIREYKTME